MTDKVLYAELTPQEFRDRIAAAPIAYLPLGTLEWHGEHLPLGSDGLQAQGFFEALAREAGGIVLPMLFVGPDRHRTDGERELYGMDICTTRDERKKYPDQQLPGSAYWVGQETFGLILEAILKQLQRAGFRIVVAHGHGPSTSFFRDRAQQWRSQFGLSTFCCWGSEYDKRGLGIQTDHAAANETSLVLALRPDLAQMDRLSPDPDDWPLAIGGQDPRTDASAAVGAKAVALQTRRMSGLLREALAELGANP